jgi:predicted phage terminase large subunit-like protein
MNAEKSLLWHDMATNDLRQHARSSMLAFTKHMNPDFRINWHHRVICSHLDRFISGEINRLAIFIQPQIGKSELVSRHLPAMIFGKDPDHRLIASSYGDAFASEFNLDVQRIMESEKYQALFPESRLMGPGVRGNWVRNSSHFEIVERKGEYHSVGVGGSLTGRTGYTLLIDDPVKNAEDARSLAFREKQWRWFKTTARTRLRRDRFGNAPRILLTMTRWHHDDLAARILAEMKANPNLPQWTVLSFPALREDLENPLDPRRLDEPLWPEMVSRSDCDELMADAKTWNSLYMQRPAPEKGTIFQRDWWQYYTVLPSDLEKTIQSWDLTFTEGPSTDWVVGQIWGRKGANKYLIDQFRARVGFNGQVMAVQAMSAKHPSATSKYIEKAANGHAVHETLKNKISGIILVPPKGSKVVRAEAISGQVQAGNVFLPDPSIAPWIGDFVEEHAHFPDGKHDDQVDACSMALSLLDNGRMFDVAPVSMTGLSKWNKY